MKSNMTNRFAIVPDIEIPRSTFSRASSYKTTFNEDLLIPIFTDEVLPGDTFNLNVAHLIRLSTPIFPVMDNIHIDMHFFFVPNRIIWENWERMNGAQDNPGDTVDYLVPQVTGTPITGSMADYFGLPLGKELSVNALYFRAYNLIYNEWYRDQNLINSVPVPKGDGPDNLSTYALQKRAKRHDYFTSALPWPQKGPGVEIPLSGNANVYGDGSALRYMNILSDGSTVFPLGHSSNEGNSIRTGQNWSNGFATNGGSSLSSGSKGYYSSIVGTKEASNGESIGLYADLSSVGAATINDIRQAFAIQRLYERDARGGTRYVEILKSHFGVTSPDFRLQRPEFLGGYSEYLNVTPVVNQTGTNNRAQGDLAGMGMSAGSKHGFHASFTEHGVIIGLLNIWADLTYQQGIERRFSRRDRLDYYLPALSHLGEQAILNKEIYYNKDANDDKAFGYQERYAEYRYKNSLITGKMRSSDPQSLDAWHLSQNFANLPTLNKTFIESTTPINRVVAVQEEPHFIGDFFFDLKTTRPIPLYGTPGMLDHF